MPLLISSMTGGYADAERINRELAEVCETFKIPMGVGSQRQAMENSTYHASFKAVRMSAPSVPILSNIGAAEVAQLHSSDRIEKIIDLIEADALYIHINPLQELLQPEGSPNFRGVLVGIERLVKSLSIPVFVKEVGAGISKQVAKRLLDVGVNGIDVAGAGGTSWAGVEILRNKEQNSVLQFWEWGIPTVESLLQVASLKPQFDFTLISSGGIHSANDIALSIAFGADCIAMARPLLQTLIQSGQLGLEKKLNSLSLDLRRIMFLIGAPDCKSIRSAEVVKK
ncbi:MAG: type 2 isopentenyl-diphosphate Delta-isomerase [Ignavibacteria bacterium]|nr:type 2 isopentenyl-diphosphate Delta-isomerase [Ignavibacteria bacterium]